MSLDSDNRISDDQEVKKNNAKRSEIYKLWASGLSYRAIGKKVGITRQRVQQIVRPKPEILRTVRARTKDLCEGCGIYLRLGDGHLHHAILSQLASEFNDPNNLLYLCRSCHRLAHS